MQGRARQEHRRQCLEAGAEQGQAAGCNGSADSEAALGQLTAVSGLQGQLDWLSVSLKKENPAQKVIEGLGFSRLAFHLIEMIQVFASVISL